LKLRILYRRIIFFICVLQLVIAPFLSYSIFNESNNEVIIFNYFMSVSMSKYFLIVIPSLLAFYFGLFYKFNFIRKNIKSINLYKTLQSLKESKSNFQIGLLIFLFNVFCFVLARLEIFFHVNISARILESAFLVSLFYFLYSKNILRIFFIFLNYSFFIFNSIQSGMFGTLFFTTFLILIFYMDIRKISFKKIIFNSILIIILFLSFQVVKSEYREATFDGINKNSNASLYIDLLIENFKNPELIFNEQTLFLINVRLNQGHFLSKVIDHVPKFENYTYGKNILTGFAAAFVPRIIWKNKPKSGGMNEITKFANVDYDGSTSINISPIGEAYVCFGLFSAIGLMYLFGLLINYIWSKFEYKSIYESKILLWLPIFILPIFQAPEENLSSIFNYMIKFAFLFYVCYITLPKIFFNEKITN